MRLRGEGESLAMAPQVNHDAPTPSGTPRPPSVTVMAVTPDTAGTRHTAATPAPIRLTDLARPQFSAEAAPLLAAGAEMASAVSLEPDRLVHDAIAAVGGLDDFGPDGWQEPLDVLSRAYRSEAGLSRFGTVSIHAQLVQILTNRLLLEDLVRRRPEVLERRVEAPIVIAGLPRTGTTHLHNLLAADPALRSLPYWEAIEPLPAPNDPPDSIEPRVERCAGGLAMSDLFIPEMQRMHEMTAWHTHEEIHLLAMDCSTMFFDTLAPMPTWREYYRSTDQTPHYRYLERVLRVLQSVRPAGSRWVLKSPQHLEQLGPLDTAFPDATVVLTHRDPGDVIVSMTTMIAYSARMHLEVVDPVALGRHWTALADRPVGLLRGGPRPAAAGAVPRRALRRPHGRRGSDRRRALRAGRAAARRRRPSRAPRLLVEPRPQPPRRGDLRARRARHRPPRGPCRARGLLLALRRVTGQPSGTTVAVGRSGVASGWNQRNQISPCSCPWVSTQLGVPGSRPAIVMRHEPSGS